MGALGNSCKLAVIEYFFIGLVVCLEKHTIITEQGDIIGLDRKVIFRNEERTVRRYLGIPFAKPPLGDLRFKKPQEPIKFAEHFEAFSFEASCSQTEFPLFDVKEEFAEDCLFLNVFVPTTVPNHPDGYPVMIFIHGGGMDYGSSTAYVADVLAAKGEVIVVTINYRLGVFGFLSTQDERAPGNVGLWDQHFAIKWVNKNIKAFGGDIGRVTIFGESAGGASVVLQALYPGNMGLFQRVIAKSGSAFIDAVFKEDPVPALEKLAQVFDCDKDNVVSCLSTLSSSHITDKLTNVLREDMETARILTFRPTVDNDFFKIIPFEMAKKKNEDFEELHFFHSLDFMNGVNSDEGVFIAAFQAGSNDINTFEPTREQMDSQFASMAFLYYSNKEASGLAKQFLLHEYTDWANPDDPKTIRLELSRLFGDMFFNVPAVEQTQLHCYAKTHGHNFLYVFSANSQFSHMQKPNWCKGAMHGEEVGFIFGLEKTLLDIVHAEDRSIETWEADLSERMMQLWSNFAKFGNPNGLEEKLPVWPEYEMEQQQTFIITESASTDHVLSFPFARSTNFWTSIIPTAFNVTQSSDKPDDVLVSMPNETSDSCSSDNDCEFYYLISLIILILFDNIA